MSFWSVAVVGLFLPLFPLSMLSNMLLRRIESPLLLAILIFVWPQIGVLLLNLMDGSPSRWVVVWALFTSVLYALRMVAVHDMIVWSIFLFTSSLALFWIFAIENLDHTMLAIYALSFSAPLAMFVFLADSLKRRYGGTYAGAVNGLVFTLPRISSLAVLIVLAVIATPTFPGFAVLLSLLTVTATMSHGASLAVLAIWFLWSWAAALLLKELLVGDVRRPYERDFGTFTTGFYGILLGALLVFGIWLVGVIP